MSTLTPKVTLTSNGDTGVVDFRGGEAFYMASGTWGSGTTALMVYDGTSYISAGVDGILSSDGMVRFTLPACLLKVTLSGATTPSLTISIDSVN